jgi:hypothetical protein
VNRTKALMQHFDALSRANLVILAAWFGVIDPRSIAVSDEPCVVRDVVAMTHCSTTQPKKNWR